MAHNTYAMPRFENFAHSDDDDNSGEGEDSEGQSPNASYGGGTGRGAAITSIGTQDGSLKRKRPGGKGKRKIAIEYIADKSKRAVTFSKRKAGIFTKARELSTLTGSSLLLLVVSQSGVVYTYTSEKFIPMVTQDAGKNMIAACLNGTVNLSERFSSSIPGQSRLSSSRNADAQPKRGGDILLKKAFESGTSPAAAGGGDDGANLSADGGRVSRNGKDRHAGSDAAERDLDDDGQEASNDMAERSPSPAISALPPLPPMPNYHPPEASTSGRHSRRSVPTVTSASNGIYNEEDIHHHANSPDLRITSNEADDLDEDGEKEISDEECDRRMRTLRRSLSIERHYERISEEQRPRVVRHSVGGRESGLASTERDHDQDVLDRTSAAGAGAADGQGQSTTPGTSTMSALDLTPDAFRGFGYSFARSAEDWDNVKQRFDIPPSIEDSSNHHSQQQQGHLGNASNHRHRAQAQSRRGQHSARGARGSTMPMQMAALPEL